MDTSTASEQSNKTYEDAAVNLCTSFATTVDTARVARRGSPAIDLRSIFWILLEARCIRAHGVDHLPLFHFRVWCGPLFHPSTNDLHSSIQTMNRDDGDAALQLKRAAEEMEEGRSVKYMHTEATASMAQSNAMAVNQAMFGTSQPPNTHFFVDSPPMMTQSLHVPAHTALMSTLSSAPTAQTQPIQIQMQQQQYAAAMAGSIRFGSTIGLT